MNKIWILVASHQIARVFTADSVADDWREIEDLIDPSARLHGRDLESDRPGRRATEAGAARHGLERKQDVRVQALTTFSARIAKQINAAHRVGRIAKLYLIAEPRVLGQLRKDLDKNTHAAIVGQLAQDLVKEKPADIRRHLLRSQ